MHRNEAASRCFAGAVLVLTAFLMSAPASAETWSDWYYVGAVDPATNAVSAKAQVVIKATSETDLYSLGVTCAAGRVAVSLQSTDRHFKPGAAKVTWKTDRGKQHGKDPWQALAETDQMLFAQSPQELLAELTAGRKLFFGVSDAGGQTLSLVFPLSGAKEAVRGAFSECSGTEGADAAHDPVEKLPTYLLLRAGEVPYPGKAKQAGKSGTATVSYTVDAEGRVEDVKVVSEDPEGWGFGEAAVDFVKKWRYLAEVKDGKPVRRAGIEVPIMFGPNKP